MKIALIGYGNMGRHIEERAVEKGMEIVSIIDPYNADATHKEFCEEAMRAVDVCVCFTQPDAAIKNITDACQWGKQIVIGTTGWTDQMSEVKRLVEKSGVGLVYSSNFSIGVNIFFKLIEQAAQVFNRFDIYDVLAFEAHHNRKFDSPSGTARTISTILLDGIDRKKRVVEERLGRKIEADELHVASMRGGSIPGTHSVLFDSEFDTIEVKHTARNRRGFATGAVIAAEWIRERKGVYTESDMMNQLL